MNGTDDLIKALAADAAPVRRFPAPSVIVSGWGGVAVAGIVPFIMLVGARPDLSECFRQPRFLLDIAAALLTAIGAAWAATVSALPGRPPWQLALPVIPALAWVGLQLDGAWSDPTPMRPDLICLPTIVAFGLLPCAFLVRAMRRGAVLTPSIGLFLAVSASASLAYVGLRMVHPQDAERMVLAWQFGPVVLLSLLAACFGGWLFPRKPPDFPTRGQ